jgi:RNA polymerase sigma-70 factor (ECF subfamily)
MNAAEKVARESYGKLVAFLAARTRDVAGAEDALSEAFAAALLEWPVSGVPRTPEAWLLTVARRRLVDAARHRIVSDAAAPSLLLLADEIAPDVHSAGGGSTGLPDFGGEIPDDRLRLMFVCAHPALEAGVRAPLMLQTVLGFDAARIASAFLVAPSAMSQRLVRAKSRIRQAGIPFRVPERDELAERLDAVLQAVYAIFSEGWSDPAGSVAASRGLTEEAIWLGRLLVAMLPQEPEALGLLSLMLHAEARRDARRDAQGEFVPLAEQEPAAWNAGLIDEAEDWLLQAASHGRAGRFQLEAAVQSVHAARRRSGVTDWAAVVQLYDALFALTGSVVVAINRAVALAAVHAPAGAIAFTAAQLEAQPMRRARGRPRGASATGGPRGSGAGDAAVAAAEAGARAGLAELDKLASDARVVEYQPYWAARAALLAQAGRSKEAPQANQRANGQADDPAQRRHLQPQADAVAGGTPTKN